MELHFINPSNGQFIHDSDRVEVLDLAGAQPESQVTLHVRHPDGSSDDIPCSQH